MQYVKCTQAHDQVGTNNMEPATSDQMTAVNLLTAQNVDAQPATLVQVNFVRSQLSFIRHLLFPNIIALRELHSYTL